MGRIDAPCSLKLPAPSRGASAATHLLQALALLSAAGPAGKSDVLRHRDTAAERPVVAGKRGRRLYSSDRPFPRLCLYDVSRHSCPPGPRRSAASACSSVWLQLRPRDGAGNFRLHGASMRPMQRALVEF